MEFGSFFQVPVNYLAVVACAIASMIIGYLWYGPLFGKQWYKLAGFTTDKIAKLKKEMPKSYTAIFIASLVMAYILFHLIWYAAPGSYTLFISLKTAFWAWLGFIVPVSLSKYLFTPDRKPIRLMFIEIEYFLITLLIMSVIFFLFK